MSTALGHRSRLLSRPALGVLQFGDVEHNASVGVGLDKGC